MRRTSTEKPDANSQMAEASATRGAGYRPVPTNEGTSTLSRSGAPVYGIVKPARSPASLFCLAATVLSVALALVFTMSDMRIGDRLRAALFSSHSPSAPAPTSKLSPAAAASLNAFGLRLFARVAADAGGDVVVSPASIASALTMAAAGATDGSQAAKELEALLGAGIATPQDSGDDSVELRVANAAWVAKSVRDSYVTDIKKTLGAEVFPVPKDVAVINDWVSKATRGNIPSILDSIPDRLVAMLVNAVFFKASWTTSFDPKQTVDAPFYGPSGKSSGAPVATVRMMKLVKERFPYSEVRVPGKAGETLKIVELPYGKKNEYAATIVVPTGKMTITEVVDLFKDGNSKLWDDWIQGLTTSKLDVLAMPRFKIEYGVKSLKETLQGMGVKAAFKSDPANPPFFRMTDDKETYLDDVLHKATIECTEEGTVASAATAVVIMARSMPMAMPSVILDRPFLFTIRNRVSGAIMFLGRVDKPVSP